MSPKSVNVPPSLEAAFNARDLTAPGALVRDGKWHPLDALDDDPGEGNGRYCVPPDEPLVVMFTNWKDGLPCEHWRGQGNGHARKIPPEELAAMQAEADRARAERQSKAAEAVRAIWERAAPATPGHPYLKAKGIKKTHGLRVKSFNRHKGALCVPLHSPAGELASLQYIDPELDAKGTFPREYHPGALRRGTFCTFGPWPPKPKGGIVIAEGMATAVSIQESTGRTVVAAMDAGNLLPVAVALRAKFPRIRFTFFADNDRSRVGIVKAIKAAEAVDGNVCMSPTEGDDANDLYRREGPGAVKAVLASSKPVGEWKTEQTGGRDTSPASAGTDDDGVRPAHSPATTSGPGGLRLWTMNELLAADMPDPVPLIDKILYPETLAVLGAADKVGKTWCAYQLALCAASGSMFLGHPIPRKLRVLYIGGEGVIRMIRKRLRLAKAHVPRLTAADQNNVVLCATVGRLKLDTPEGTAWLHEKSAGFDIVIVDPYYRFLATGSENDHADQRVIQDVFDELKAAGKGVVLCHHVRKTQAGRRDNSLTTADIRGAGMKEYADQILLLWRIDDRVTNREKQRYKLSYTLRHDEPVAPLDLVTDGPLFKPAGIVVTVQDFIDAIEAADKEDRALNSKTLQAAVRQTTGGRYDETEDVFVQAVAAGKIHTEPIPGKGRAVRYRVGPEARSSAIGRTAERDGENFRRSKSQIKQALANRREVHRREPSRR